MPVGQNLSSSAYSNWRYTLNPAAYSASIKEGNNKITPKMLCEGNPVSITKFYSINVSGVNETLPELVTANSNASGAPSVLPVSSNISLANQSSSDPTSNTNPSSSSDRTSGSVHHHHHHHESSVHQKNVNDKVTGDSNHHKKQSSPSNHHHNNIQGKGSDLAHNIITRVEKRLGI
jgi:LysM repeat protein